MVVISYLGETILAVHLTVEEGLKLKIAMKGGLGGKLKRVLCRPSSVPFLPQESLIMKIYTFTSNITLSRDLSSPVTLFPPTTLSSPLISNVNIKYMIF